MIHYNDLEIGAVYKPTIKIHTTDYSHEITTDSCFIVLGKREIQWVNKDIRCRLTIFYNDMKQILVMRHDMPLEKVV